jgi:hypothetical protein
MGKRLVLYLFLTLTLGVVLNTQTTKAQTDTGILEFRANGEGFVREGFTSKDGWSITFEHVYVSLANIQAHQTNPPFDALSEDMALEPLVSTSLPDSYWIDLAEGDETAEPIFIGVVEDAPVGRYNALSWQMPRQTEGDFAGYTVVIIGTATKESASINFTLKIENEYEYTCGEFVGDARKGIVQTDNTADLELTFHFDHIFGDGQLPADDGLNVNATGFDMLAVLAQDNKLDVDLKTLQTALAEEDYLMYENILPSLGHVGEGHCRENTLHESPHPQIIKIPFM